MRIRALVMLAAFLAFTVAMPTGARAADKVRIMVGGVEKQIYLPAKLAEQLGYFKDEGLDVELLSEPAGVNAEDELLAGAVQGVVGFYDHTIDLQSKGKFVESVVQLSHAPGEVELVATKQAKSIKSPADWRGKTLGVTGLGSSTNFLTQYIGLKYGLKPGDFTSLPVGAGNTFIAAIMQGKIDGGMTTEPTVSRLLKTGEAQILVDLRTEEQTKKVLGGTYPAAALYMQTGWVDSHREVTQKLANAFVRSLRFIATHSAAQIADKMPADYYAGDKAMYIKALAGSKSMFTTDGRMPESGPRTVLAVLAAFSRTVKGKNIDLARTYTSEFVTAARKTAAR
ncbi:MAG TPA: ABC transporter substrate-binding protein [Candidatus Elarobacter sp.]|jgi:NitT/TauT family transport system substrate-binding protein|nr:ABC transporter substrate-binding protein [Candidatus Elarobacter sp.]